MLLNWVALTCLARDPSKIGSACLSSVRVLVSPAHICWHKKQLQERLEFELTVLAHEGLALTIAARPQHTCSRHNHHYPSQRKNIACVTSQ